MVEKNFYPDGETSAGHEPDRNCWCHPIIEIAGIYTEIHHNAAKQVARQRDTAEYNAERWMKLAKKLAGEESGAEVKPAETEPAEPAPIRCNHPKVLEFLEFLGADLHSTEVVVRITAGWPVRTTETHMVANPRILEH